MIDAQSADLKSSDVMKQKQAAANVKYLEGVRSVLDGKEVCPKSKLPDPKKVVLPTLPPCWKKTGAKSKAAYDAKATEAAKAITAGILDARSIVEAHTSTKTGKAEPGFERLVDEAANVLKQFQALNEQLDQLNTKADTQIQDCPESKTPTGGGGGGQKKEPPKKHPKRAQRTATGLYSLMAATDSEIWCTYGDGDGTPITLMDEAGSPVVVALQSVTTSNQTAPTSDRAPTVPAEETVPSVPRSPSEQPLPTVEATPSEQPPTTPETPKVTEKTPEQPPPATPETPKVTEKTPEQPPPATPETPKVTEKPPEPTSPIPDTIFVKAKESVLEGQPTGNPIQNQVVKLFPTDKPDLPGTGTKTAQDTGFDENPVQCATGADGGCTMQVPVGDRLLYGLPSTDQKKPGQKYRVDYDLPKQSGGVVETTGKGAQPDLKTGTPATADINTEEFKIGNRTFVRLSYKLPYGVTHDFREQFTPTYGSNYEEDYCRDKQPGPPLGMQPNSLNALNHDLPEAIVNIGRAIRVKGSTP